MCLKEVKQTHALRVGVSFREYCIAHSCHTEPEARMLIRRY